MLNLLCILSIAITFKRRNKNIYKYYIWSLGSYAGAFQLYVNRSLSSAGVLLGVTFFRSEKIAQKAIDYIVKPFLNEHPDFVW